MFYIIETKEQLAKFSTYDLSDSFVEFILQDDRMHPAIAEVSLIYIKPVKSRTGFIIPINHSEGFSLGLSEIIAFIGNKVANMTVFDAKKMMYFIGTEKSLKCLKMAKFIETSQLIDHSLYDTQAHKFLQGKYPYRSDINRLIPICKHQEKWNNLLKDNKIRTDITKKQYFTFYSNDYQKVLYGIEKTGITMNSDSFFSHYTPKQDIMSVKDNTIYTQYNSYTLTGRPSNAFNGINFAALKKDDSRAFIIPENDILIEFDFSAYHPRILTKLVDYQFDEEDIHSHLGKLYFNTDKLTKQQYEDSKGMTFKYLYTNAGDSQNIAFFKQVKEFKDYLWGIYKEKHYIKSPITKIPIKDISNKTQILPYILQRYETERNISIINRILDYLSDKKTRIILYSYDALLIDYAKSDGDEVLDIIKETLEEDDFPVNISYGKNYSKMKKYPILHTKKSYL